MSTFVSSYCETGEAIQKIDKALLKTGYQFGALSLGLLMGWISKILVSRPHLHDFQLFYWLYLCLMVLLIIHSVITSKFILWVYL